MKKKVSVEDDQSIADGIDLYKQPTTPLNAASNFKRSKSKNERILDSIVKDYTNSLVDIAQTEVWNKLCNSSGTFESGKVPRTLDLVVEGTYSRNAYENDAMKLLPHVSDGKMIEWANFLSQDIDKLMIYGPTFITLIWDALCSELIVRKMKMRHEKVYGTTQDRDYMQWLREIDTTQKLLFSLNDAKLPIDFITREQLGDMMTKVSVIQSLKIGIKNLK